MARKVDVILRMSRAQRRRFKKVVARAGAEDAACYVLSSLSSAGELEGAEIVRIEIRAKKEK